jgi:hypothetical protein
MAYPLQRSGAVLAPSGGGRGGRREAQPMSNLRTMQEDDLERFIEIEAAAFGAWHRQTYGRAGRVPPRTQTNVRSCLVQDPAGCFVAETEDQVVG